MAITNFKRIDSDEVGHSVPFQYNDVNTVSGTTYTILGTDAGDIVKFSSASSVSVTLPTNATTYIPVGTVLTLLQIGDGTVNISPAVGVTIYQEPGNSITNGDILRTRAKYSKIQLTKIGTNEWLSDGYGLYIQATAPTNPQPGDLWIW
jgi:hypothetical protein